MKLSIFSALILLLPFCAGQVAAAPCAENNLELRGPWGQARFTVEVADDEAERNQGLMFRTELAAAEGMLFTYEHPRQPTFWMKNTLIALDMLFITPQGVVQYVHSMARPNDLSLISGGDGILMVLEIRGGMANIMGIAKGSEVRHIALDQSLAAWPCDFSK